MTITEIMAQAQHLSTQERKELVKLLVDLLDSPTELSPKSSSEPVSVLETLLSLRLEGPPDWSENIDKYLYGWVDQDEA